MAFDALPSVSVSPVIDLLIQCLVIFPKNAHWSLGVSEFLSRSTAQQNLLATHCATVPKGMQNYVCTILILFKNKLLG